MPIPRCPLTSEAKDRRVESVFAAEIFRIAESGRLGVSGAAHLFVLQK